MIRIKEYWWCNAPHGICDAKFIPILGKNYSQRISAYDEYYPRIPLIHWLDKTQSEFLLIKHPDLFEVYD